MKPLVPSNIDLRDFVFMPMDVHRLLTSDTWILSTGDERAAFICLLLASWHQMPAGSLPENDRMLAHLSMASDWPAVKEQALRGWELADDGRYYHKVVAEKVMEAWLEKLAQRLSSGSGNSSRWGVEFDAEAIENAMDKARCVLAELNPSSRTLRKRRTAKKVGAKGGGVAKGAEDIALGFHQDSLSNSGGIPSGQNDAPDGNADGTPAGNPSSIPMLSQETGTGTGTGTGTSKAKDQKQSARDAHSPDKPGSPSAGRREQKISMAAWLDELDATDEDAVPASDTIFDWASNAGISDDFLALSWLVFRDGAIASGKQQKNWRQTYRNYVQKGYLKLWYFDRSTGECLLTTVGVQAHRQYHQEAA